MQGIFLSVAGLNQLGDRIHNTKMIVAEQIRTLEIVPEPDNPYDPHAMRVQIHGGLSIGYISRKDLAEHAHLFQGRSFPIQVHVMEAGEIWNAQTGHFVFCNIWVPRKYE